MPFCRILSVFRHSSFDAGCCSIFKWGLSIFLKCYILGDCISVSPFGSPVSILHFIGYHHLVLIADSIPSIFSSDDVFGIEGMVPLLCILGLDCCSSFIFGPAVKYPAASFFIRYLRCCRIFLSTVYPYCLGRSFGSICECWTVIGSFCVIKVEDELYLFTVRFLILIFILHVVHDHLVGPVRIDKVHAVAIIRIAHVVDSFELDRCRDSFFIGFDRYGRLVGSFSLLNCIRKLKIICDVGLSVGILYRISNIFSFIDSINKYRPFTFIGYIF